MTSLWIHAAVNYGWHKSSGNTVRAAFWGRVSDALLLVRGA